MAFNAIPMETAYKHMPNVCVFITQKQLQTPNAASKRWIHMDHSQQLINTVVYLLHESVQNTTT